MTISDHLQQCFSKMRFYHTYNLIVFFLLILFFNLYTEELAQLGNCFKSENEPLIFNQNLIEKEQKRRVYHIRY